MKKILIATICLLCLAQSACERDDICAETTPTTPLLVIAFFDADNVSVEKAPVNLSITADGTVTSIPVVNSASVSIPLFTNQDVTTFRFEINSGEDDLEEPNTDQITFTYARTEDFVSSACGFRVVYNDLQELRDTLDDGAWIQDIEITNPTVNDETTTHVTIFH